VQAGGGSRGQADCQVHHPAQPAAGGSPAGSSGCCQLCSRPCNRHQAAGSCARPLRRVGTRGLASLQSERSAHVSAVCASAVGQSAMHHLVNLAMPPHQAYFFRCSWYCHSRSCRQHGPAQSQSRHCPSTLWGMALGCSGTSHTDMHAFMCFRTVLLSPPGTAPCMQWPGAPYIAVPFTPSTLPWLHALHPCRAVPACSCAVHAVTLGCMTCNIFSRSTMQGPASWLRSWWPTRH
jgi:hypothetical protein